MHCHIRSEPYSSPCSKVKLPGQTSKYHITITSMYTDSSICSPIYTSVATSTSKNDSLHVWSFGRDEMIWSSISMLPSISTAISVRKREYTSERRIFISTVARLHFHELNKLLVILFSVGFDLTYLRPVQPLAPVAKAKKRRSRSTLPFSSSQRSGLNRSGSGNTSAFTRCTVYGWQLTIVCCGMK